MCTRWTLTRLVRWRVRDLASCFLACRFPLEEEEEEETHGPSLPQLPIRNMVFETKYETRDKKRLSRRNRYNNDRQLNQSTTTMSRNIASVGNGSTDNSSWPCFSDEEYIVFSFREDGAFDVVKDDTDSRSKESNELSRSLRPVNRKLIYAEDPETDKQSSDEGRSNGDGYNGENITAKEGDGERSSICLEVELASAGSLRRRRHVDETPRANRGTVSAESSDSSQSDGSSGSFAFPVLGWEWMGSPVQMPKSEGMNPRKNKALSVRFQCFRF